MARVFRSRGVTIRRRGPLSIYELGDSMTDTGPAGVHAVAVGDLEALDSMVDGELTGASSYNDGSAYILIPGDQPQHDLSAVTISFYYQRNDDAAKQILFNAGDGNQPGDFSIEIQPDGRLRAWHTAQDSTAPSLFTDWNGIPGTNLEVDTAYRIDLSLGPTGARIYLDGSEVSSIPANTNGWNNARTKYLLRWNDGIQLPAIGAIDKVRIYSRQLSQTEIDALEDAISITIGSPPSTSTEPLFPSTSEFLDNDDTSVPGSNVRWAKLDGAGVGGTTEGGAGEVQTTLSASTGGDTVVCVGGAYDKTGGLTIPAGVTLMAKPGDTVVISRGEEFAAFQTPSPGSSSTWELVSGTIALYRSVATFSPTSSVLKGFWVEFGHAHYLCPYTSLTQLQAAYTTGSSPGSYAGPGAYLHSDGRVYIRMQKPHPEKYGFGSPWAPYRIPYGFTNPECVAGGKLNYPFSQDPRSYRIHIARDNSNISFTTASGAKIGAGINSWGYLGTLPGNGWTGVEINRGLHHAWRQFLGIGGFVSNLFCDRARFTRGSTRHLARNEFKFGGWLDPQRGAFIEHQGSGTSQDLYFRDCTIHGFHEIMVGPNQHDRRYRFLTCTIADILDDGFQWQPAVSRVEYAYCYFLCAALGGNAEIAVVATIGIGEFFQHHCIIDLRFIKMDEWGVRHRPMFGWLNHSQNRPQPRKSYNNTLLYGPDIEDRQHTMFVHDNINNNTAGTHETFNNIVVRMDDRRYTISGGINTPNDVVQDRIRNSTFSGTNEYYDYNCYHKAVPSPSSNFLAVGFQEPEGSGTGYPSLAALQAAHGTLEQNSIQVEPQMGAVLDWAGATRSYRPGVECDVGTSASLSGQNWWTSPPSWGTPHFAWSGLAPDPWMGALDPNGSTMPVGVQSP